LSKYDLIAIYETWCERDCDIDELENKLAGYKCYTQCATRVHKHGRPSGGIALYVNNKLGKHVKIIESDFKFAVIVELTGILGASHGNVNPSAGDIILVCAYLPPQNSSAYDQERNGVIMLKEQLLKLNAKYPEHKLIVAGDLNSRIGDLQDFLPNDGVDHIAGLDWYTPDEFDTHRSAKDKTVNEFGQSLIELCVEFNIHVLNGRTNGDMTGNLTNITDNGCSTVDYIMMESELHDTVKSFKVLDVDETNHMPLECIFNVKQSHVRGEGQQCNNEELTMRQQKKFRWHSDHIVNFKSQLSEGMLAEPATTVLTWPAGEVDSALQTFVDIIHNAAEPMEVTQKNCNGKKIKLQPRWWTKECEQLKAEKHCKLKIFKMSNNPVDLNDYKTARSNFKNVCKNKKLKWKEQLKEKLVNTKSDPAVFWKTIKSLNMNCMPSIEITAIEWLTYFEKLLNQDVEINVEFSNLVSGYTETHDIECDVM